MANQQQWEPWRKESKQRWATGVMAYPLDEWDHWLIIGTLRYSMPEWLIDQIIAYHNAARSAREWQTLVTELVTWADNADKTHSVAEALLQLGPIIGAARALTAHPESTEAQDSVL